MTIEELLNEIDKEQKNVALYENLLNNKMIGITLHYNELGKSMLGKSSTKHIIKSSNKEIFEEISQQLTNLYMTKLKECNDRLKELIEKKENVEKMLGE